MSHFQITVFWLLLSVTGQLMAAIPQPLRLEQALQIAMQSKHPDLQVSDAQLDLARSAYDKVDAGSGPRISLEARLAVIEPSNLSTNTSNNDSQVYLRASKRLYDFGLTQAQLKAAKLGVSATRWQGVRVRQQHYLDVMERFFAVLLADAAYTVSSEETSLASFLFDNAQDRQELGKLSDVKLLELKNAYYQSRQKRNRAQQKQQLTRAALALSLNQANDSPSDLVEPKIDWNNPLPEYEDILAEVLVADPVIQELRQKLASARASLAAAEKADNPVIGAELLAADYSRKTGATHPLMAAITLKLPLYQGGATRAAIAGSAATVQVLDARLQSRNLQLREEVLELLMKLESLKTQLEAVEVSAEYSEIYLDQNRALYELEVASDLGDAMIRTTRVILARKQALYDFALTRARLDALRGKLLPQPPVFDD